MEYACVVWAASLEDIVIHSGATADASDAIVCHVDGVGVLQGTVDDTLPEGFSIRLTAGAVQRERLAGRLRWHRERASGRADLRQGARVVPDWPAVAVTWPGRAVPGTLRDASSGGAAIDLAPRPPVGTPVTVGRRRGTVIRSTEGGIGVSFVLPLRAEDVTASIVL